MGSTFACIVGRFDGWNAIAARKLDRGQMRMPSLQPLLHSNQKKTQQNKQTEKKTKRKKTTRLLHRLLALEVIAFIN